MFVNAFVFIFDGLFIPKRRSGTPIPSALWNDTSVWNDSATWSE